MKHKTAMRVAEFVGNAIVIVVVLALAGLVLAAGIGIVT